MKHFFKRAVGIVVLAMSGLALAQVAVPGGLPPGFPHALYDVLGSRAGFYGTAKIFPAGASDQASLFCHIAVLGGAMRLEVESFQSGSNSSPAQAALLSQMHTITLVRPDQNRMYMLFPRFKSYVEVTFGPNTGTAAVNPPAITKTAMTNETIGDHVCKQAAWSVTEANAEHYDLTVWTAADYGDFPIQIKLNTPPTLVKFDDLELQPPNGNLFDPPADYTKYEGVQELILKKAAEMQKTNSP